MDVISVSIVCITVLLVTSGVLWFANRFLTTAKVREHALKNEIKFMVQKEHQDMVEKLDKFTTNFKEDINTLTKNHLVLVDNQKSIHAAVSMSGGRTGSIATVLDQFKKSRV